MKREVLLDLQDRYFDFKEIPLLPAHNFIDQLNKLVAAGTTVILTLCQQHFPEYLLLMRSQAEFFEQLMASLMEREASQISLQELEDIKALVVNFAEGDETGSFFDLSLYQLPALSKPL